jgi:hypothetical protein
MSSLARGLFAVMAKMQLMQDATGLLALAPLLGLPLGH